MQSAVQRWYQLRNETDTEIPLTAQCSSGFPSVDLTFKRNYSSIFSRFIPLSFCYMFLGRVVKKSGAYP